MRAATFARQMAAFLAASTVLGLLAAALVVPFVAIPTTLAARGADAAVHAAAPLARQPLEKRVRILAADGTPIATLYRENRVVVPLSAVSQPMKDAVLSVEDTRFYTHPGLDMKGVLRALSSGGRAGGGSTLTQQYVKNVLLNNAQTRAGRERATERSASRKIREALLALDVERNLSKDQILEGYLNIAYFGSGAYGIEAAAERYFSVHARDLTVTQAALLAGLVQSPNAYAPTLHPEAATDRRDTVLARMRDTGRISRAVHDKAVKAGLGLKPRRVPNGCDGSAYPLFCQWVLEEILSDPTYGATSDERADYLYTGGLTIRTTLQPRVQQAAQKAVDDALGRSQKAVTGVAVVVPGTGQVAALATNRGFGDGKTETRLLVPTLPAYQPGSTFKTFTLAAAIEAGWNPRTVMTAPSRYCPPPPMLAPSSCFSNEAAYDAGTMTAATALARSSNTFYVKLEAQVGVLATAAMARNLGVSLPTTITAADSATTLGVHDTSPLEVANAYATFAAHGTACRPVGITAITDATGKARPVTDPACRQVMRPSTAAAVTEALVGVIDGPDALRSGKRAHLGRPAGGKTGTTNNRAAVWFAGITPQYAGAVWVGDLRGPNYPLRTVQLYGERVKVGGANVSAPIWAATMREALAGTPATSFATETRTLSVTSATRVPDVRGLGVLDAATALQQAGLHVSLTVAAKPLPGLARDTVVAQSVPGGADARGQRVTLTLQAGSDPRQPLPVPASQREGGVISPAAPGTVGQRTNR